MYRVLDLLRAPPGPDRAAAWALVSRLPAYQIALWPDGWELDEGGGVWVWDTHAMAEARRWYGLAERNRSREDARRVMSMHGVFVPRAIVDLAGRRFSSEQAASVAVKMIACEWVSERRCRFLEAPERALAERSLSWRGSRHEPDIGLDRVRELIEEVIRICVGEHLIPNAGYHVGVRSRQGYGVGGYRCLLDACLDRDAAARVLEVLRAALVPWNRAVVRGGASARLIEIELAPRRAGSSSRDGAEHGDRKCGSG
jgi:hypothetical protein